MAELPLPSIGRPAGVSRVDTCSSHGTCWYPRGSKSLSAVIRVHTLSMLEVIALNAVNSSVEKLRVIPSVTVVLGVHDSGAYSTYVDQLPSVALAVISKFCCSWKL